MMGVENIRQLLELRRDSSPHREFLFSEPDGRVFTYLEFDREVNRAANMLLELGARRGDRVSLFLNNSAEYLIFYFACFKIGAWANPINALLKWPEVQYIISHSGSQIAVTESNLYQTLIRASEDPPLLRYIIVAGADLGGCRIESDGIEALEYRVGGSARSDELEWFDISSEDEAVLIYTSGTTGRPKGVMLTHGNILANARQIAEWLRLTEADRSLIVMPLFHVNALMTTCMAALWAGGQIVVMPRFSASRHWEVVARRRVTYFGSVATMLTMLSEAHPGGVPEGLDISSLRFALCGSAPVPVEVMKRFESLFGCPVIEGYGLTESTCRSTFNPIVGRRPGSVGLPIGNQMKIFDDEDRELGPNQIGEIVLRGPNIMKGYYRDEEATRRAFRSGWFHTGDLGYYDEDGFFYVVDRKSDMIIRGGENIYPREIDEVLYSHPKVKDAATVGVPDPLYGQEVKSFVVLREGEGATQEELIEFCRARLADFKCPKTIEFLDEIPKGPTGKALKRELVARASKTSRP